MTFRTTDSRAASRLSSTTVTMACGRGAAEALSSFVIAATWRISNNGEATR